MGSDQPIIIIKKKKGGHGGHHGGAWKVAYADFVTAMMAFFLVMWLVAQSKPVKQAIGGYFRDPGIFDNAKSNGPIAGATEAFFRTETATRRRRRRTKRTRRRRSRTRPCGFTRV